MKQAAYSMRAAKKRFWCYCVCVFASFFYLFWLFVVSVLTIKFGPGLAQLDSAFYRRDLITQFIYNTK